MWVQLQFFCVIFEAEWAFRFFRQHALMCAIISTLFFANKFNVLINRLINKFQYWVETFTGECSISYTGYRPPETF